MLPTPTDPLAHKNERMTTLGVRITASMLEELQAAADRRDMASSALARSIVADWLERDAKGAKR